MDDCHSDLIFTVMTLAVRAGFSVFLGALVPVVGALPTFHSLSVCLFSPAILSARRKEFPPSLSGVPALPCPQLSWGDASKAPGCPASMPGAGCTLISPDALSGKMRKRKRGESFLAQPQKINKGEGADCSGGKHSRTFLGI